LTCKWKVLNIGSNISKVNLPIKCNQQVSLEKDNCSANCHSLAHWILRVCCHLLVSIMMLLEGHESIAYMIKPLNLLTQTLQQSFLKIPSNYKCHCRTTIFYEWAPLW